MSKWRDRYDEVSREVLVNERFMYLRESVRNGKYPGPTFREYLRARSESLSRVVWRDRMDGRMPDYWTIYSCLTIERYLRLSPKREPVMDRETWLDVNSTLRVSNMEVSGPVARMVGAGWTITRVGSVWHRDEEYHIFVPTGVLEEAHSILSKGSDGAPIVTPIFLFRKEGAGVIAAEEPEIRDRAATRVGQMITETVAGGKSNE